MRCSYPHYAPQKNRAPIHHESTKSLRPVESLISSPRHGYCEVFFWGGESFWKVLILGNRTFAQEPRWLHGAWWTRTFCIRSSNWIVPNTAHDQARSVDYLRVGRSMFRRVILVTRIPRVHVGLYHASCSHRGSWVHVRLPRTETFQNIFP